VNGSTKKVVALALPQKKVIKIKQPNLMRFGGR
jgi:hypothetical protein